MKKLLVIIPAAMFVASCGTAKPSQVSKVGGEVTISNGTNSTASAKIDNSQINDVIITSREYMPVEGRSETGTRADLEGAWELDSLNGVLVPGKSNLNIQAIARQAEGTEVRHDSTTNTQTVNGVTRTTTTVLIDRMGTRGNKITPPQGSNYHIPAKPTINFFGANETFSGFTGCNKYSGRYGVSGKNTISLQGAAASTKMVCLGDYDEEAFLNTLKRVNKFAANNGRLRLMEGDNTLLVFYKRQH